MSAGSERRDHWDRWWDCTRAVAVRITAPFTDEDVIQALQGITAGTAPGSTDEALTPDPAFTRSTSVRPGGTPPRIP